jgi:hypothetical protein
MFGRTGHFMRAKHESWLCARVACAGLTVVGACSFRSLSGPGDDAELDDHEMSTGEPDPSDPSSASGMTPDGTAWNGAEPLGYNPGGGNALAYFTDYGLELFLSNSTAISCDDPYVSHVCEDEPVWTYSIWLGHHADYRGRWEKDEGWIATWHSPPAPDGSCTWSGGLAVGDPSLVIESVDGSFIVGTIDEMIPESADARSYSGELAALICD